MGFSKTSVTLNPISTDLSACRCDGALLLRLQSCHRGFHQGLERARLHRRRHPVHSSPWGQTHPLLWLVLIPQPAVQWPALGLEVVPVGVRRPTCPTGMEDYPRGKRRRTVSAALLPFRPPVLLPFSVGQADREGVRNRSLGLSKMLSRNAGACRDRGSRRGEEDPAAPGEHRAPSPQPGSRVAELTLLSCSSVLETLGRGLLCNPPQTTWRARQGAFSTDWNDGVE